MADKVTTAAPGGAGIETFAGVGEDVPRNPLTGLRLESYGDYLARIKRDVAEFRRRDPEMYHGIHKAMCDDVFGGFVETQGAENGFRAFRLELAEPHCEICPPGADIEDPPEGVIQRFMFADVLNGRLHVVATCAGGNLPPGYHADPPEGDVDGFIPYEELVRYGALASALEVHGVPMADADLAEGLAFVFLVKNGQLHLAPEHVPPAMVPVFDGSAPRRKRSAATVRELEERNRRLNEKLRENRRNAQRGRCRRG